MAASIPPICDFGWQAPNFSLTGTDNKSYSLSDIQGKNGTVIVFICNHCPFVISVIDRIIRDAKDLAEIGVGFTAICSNDAVSHPQDSFENMALWAREKEFPFPYLHDEDQSVARAYDAVCTPDYFGFDASGGLQYRGRLDATRGTAGPPDLPRELDRVCRRCLSPRMNSWSSTGTGVASTVSPTELVVTTSRRAASLMTVVLPLRPVR